MVDGGGEEVGGFEDFEVPLRAPTAPGAVDDGLGLGVPADFLEGKWGSQQVFGEALAAFFVEEAVGGEDMEVWVEYEVVAEGVDGSSSGDATAGQIEAGTEGVAEGLGGGLEKEVKEMAALTEETRHHPRKCAGPCRCTA